MQMIQMAENYSNFFDRNKTQIIFAALIALVLCVYWQAVGFEFINFDDNVYVYQNPFVTNGLTRANVYWAFTAFHSANWHPLTWLSHQFDAQLFGLNAGSHHATNIFLHLINTLLCFSVFSKFTGSIWKGAFLAALFAVHPAHVESAAWVAERKDLLSTAFWLLTMLAYLRFVRVREARYENEKPAAEKKPGTPPSLKRAALLMICISGVFALGLMSKPMLVTLPFVLLLMDFWPLERLRKPRDVYPLVIEKIPLFLLSAASAAVTVIAQRAGGAVQTLEMLPFGTRFLNAAVSYAKYVLMLFYPVDLAAWYPYDKSIPVWQVGGAVILLAVISAFCFWQRSERKYLLVGWLWFLGTLVPVIGLVQVGLQSLADRYTYIPYFGLFIIIVCGADDLRKKFKIRQAMVVSITAAAVLALCALSFRQASYWRNNETLYRHSIGVTSGNFLLMQNYCHSLTLEERLDEAEKQCRDSIAANPKWTAADNSLGIIQTKRRQYDEAEQSFRNAIKNDPGFAMYRVNLAIVLANLGRAAEAEDNLRAAAESISFKVHTEIWTEAIAGLAKAYASQGNWEKAAEHFVRVLSIAPERSDIRRDFAFALYTLNKFDDAQNQIEYSLGQNPNEPAALNISGLIFMKQNKQEQAVEQFEKALQIMPDFAEAKENLKKAKTVE